MSSPLWVWQSDGHFGGLDNVEYGILQALKNYLDYHMQDISPQDSIKMEIAETRYKTNKFSFIIERYLNENEVNHFLQLIISSEFSWLALQNIESLPYEIFSYNSTRKIFEGITYNTKKLKIIDTLAESQSFSIDDDKNILESFFSYLKVTGLIDTLEEIELFDNITYNFIFLSVLISDYKKEHSQPQLKIIFKQKGSL